MEPLVLIHGFSGIPAMWEPMLPALQERFDVRALGLAVPEARAALEAEGVLTGLLRPNVLRLATYPGISDEDVEHALSGIVRALRPAPVSVS
jgi:hypothetical protein